MRILSAVIAVVTLGALQGPVAAQSRNEAAAYECGAVDDDARRLACYDALFRGDRARDRSAVAVSPGAASVSSPVAPAVAASAAVVVAPPATREPVAADPVAEFGLTGQQKERRTPPEAREKPLDAIQARVTQADQDRHGLWRLTLDNGQVWAQTEAALGARFESGSSVEIRRGALGSFVLQVPGRPVIRVRRLR